MVFKNNILLLKTFFVSYLQPKFHDRVFISCHIQGNYVIIPLSDITNMPVTMIIMIHDIEFTIKTHMTSIIKA